VSLIARISGRVSHRTLAGRVLRLPLRAIPDNLVVPVLGGINRGMRWITGAGTTSGCWLGSYEEDHAPALRQVVRPAMVAYDLGANAGFYTLALSRLVGASGRVFSFEPDARNAYLLRRHIDLNGLQNVTVVQAAISNSTRLVPFSGWQVVQKSTYLVPSVSLDEFIAAGNPAPDFVKMDIEGAEVEALEGAGSLLSKVRTNWLMATHSKELTASCKATLVQSGYRLTGFDCVSNAGEAGDFMALAN
jgi:FkbM family methyltransferase